MPADKLSVIRSWKDCHVPVPDGYEAEAVVEVVTKDWDSESIKGTSTWGVAEHDREHIAELIAQEDLTCTVEECVTAILDHCQRLSRRAK